MNVFKCGVSKIDITPSFKIEMAGMGKGNFSTGIHDRLYTRILVFDNEKEKVAVISCDLIGIDLEITEKIKKLIQERNLKIKPEDIIITATHTHYGPNTRFILPYPKVNHFYIENLCEKIVFGISEALNNLREGKVGIANGIFKKNINRRIALSNGFHYYYEEPYLLKYAIGPIDNEIGVIYIKDKNSQPISLLINYTCHPIFLPKENTLTSADFPGITTKIIEEKIGGICLFTNGALGNIGPINGLKGFRKMEEMGRELAKKVLDITKKINFNPKTKIGIITERVKLPIRKNIVYKWNMNERFKNKKFVKTEIKIFGINNCVFVGIPGEPFVEMSLELKKKSPFEYTYILSLTNDDLLYIPTPNAYKEGGYEVSVTMIGKKGYNNILNSALKRIKNLYKQLYREIRE